MREYNELTKELLAQGYTAENHPKNVRVAGGRFGKDPLENLYGGFEYVRLYAESFVYKTECGKYILGRNVIDDCFIGGFNYCHENNKCLVACHRPCEKCITYNWCVANLTDEKYDYSNSIERIRDEYEVLKRAKLEELKEKRPVCRNQVFWNKDREKWEVRYDCWNCLTYCPTGYSFCVMLNKKLRPKKGNVFFDVKKTYDIEPSKGQQLLWEQTHFETKEKGIRRFAKPINIDLAEIYARTHKKEIADWYATNNSQLFFWNKTMKIEVTNIRAEVKETRDLYQDIQDIKEGIEVVHASDVIEEKAKLKRERRKKAAEAKERKRLKPKEEQLRLF